MAKVAEAILRTVFVMKAETLILSLVFDLIKKAETLILPLAI
jgi:hypothetical protein